MLLNMGGGVTNSLAQTFKPKYLRENNRVLLNLTSLANDNGWLEFRPDKPVERINPDTFFTRFGSSIGLATDYQMRLTQDETDSYKIRHQRYQLFYKNIRVDGVEYSLHSLNQQLETAHGRIVENLAIDITKAIPEAQALTVALTDQKLSLNLFAGKPLPKGELLITRIGQEVINQNFRLCYAFDVRPDILASLPGGNAEPQRVYIDALLGQVIRRDPLIHECFNMTESHQKEAVVRPSAMGNLASRVQLAPSAFVPRWGRYQQADLTFDTEPIGGSYRLSSQNGALLTRRDLASSGSWSSNGDVLNPTTNWGTYAQNATTAHWLTQRVHQFFSRWQNGYNRQGTYPHILVDYNVSGRQVRAFWDLNDQLAFGYAPMGPSDASPNFSRTLVTADILGHEYAHAVTQFSANLEYQGESGALNESISDIFGTALERYLFPNDWNWDLGEDSYQLRDMANPRRAFPPFEPLGGQPQIYQGAGWQPTTNSFDNGGVHINSGVMNKWFHTLCTGQGPNTNISPIGFDSATDIVYRALRFYLQRTSNYADARDATSEAARSQFAGCSPEQRAVVAAWAAVGLPSTSNCESRCDYLVNVSVPNTAACNQTVLAHAACSGSCNDVLYSYYGSGLASFNGGPDVNIAVPSTSGVYTYNFYASKSGCYSPVTGFNINVSCGTPPPPPTGGGDCQGFNETCSGNDQEIRYVTLNVATAGNYPLTVTYKSGEKPVDASVRVGNTTTTIHYNQTTTYTTATTNGSVYLNQGANTIGLSSGSSGGYVCFSNICTGTGGGTPPPANCDFTISASTANATCNQTGVPLTASCSGANCDGLSYTWSGGQSGPTASFNAGGSNGSTTYTVTAARSGCSSKTANGTINVSGCGGGNPPSGGAACQGFGAVCSGNGQEVQYVSLNVATAGSYPLTISYTSHEKTVNTLVRVGNATTSVQYNQTMYGAYSTATTGSVYLAQGANTIGLSSGSEGGYVCFTNICAGNGSGRLGAGEESQEGDALMLYLYPNPNAGQFQARVATVRGRSYSLEVTNLLGRSLHRREFVGKGGVQTETFELANATTGIVLVSVQSGGKRVSKSLLIQK